MVTHWFQPVFEIAYATHCGDKSSMFDFKLNNIKIDFILPQIDI